MTAKNEWIYYDPEKPGTMSLVDFLHGLAEEGKVLTSIERVGEGLKAKGEMPYGAQYRRVYWIEDDPSVEGDWKLLPYGN